MHSKDKCDWQKGTTENTKKKRKKKTEENSKVVSVLLFHISEIAMNQRRVVDCVR